MTFPLCMPGGPTDTSISGRRSYSFRPKATWRDLISRVSTDLGGLVTVLGEMVFVFAGHVALVSAT